jgi:hypothetical protein
MWNRLGKLSDETLSNLNTFFDQKKYELKIKDYGNVKNVRVLRLEHVDNPYVLDAEFEIHSLINDNTLNPYLSYILEYCENSFTTMHVDKIGGEETDSITTVTLLHKSEDLIGGQIVIKNKTERSITVLDQNVGEIISYNHRVSHGVSVVSKGTRRVLINWYNSKADNIK